MNEAPPIASPRDVSSHVPRLRRSLFYTCLAAAVLLLALPMAPFLVIPAAWPFLGEQLGVHQFHDVGVATLLWLLLASLLAQSRRPNEQVGAMLQAVTVVLILVGATAIARPATLVSPLLLPFGFITVAAFLHPARGELVRFGRSFHRPTVVMCLLAAGPFLMYAYGQLKLDSSLLPLVAHGGHWTTMASAATSILALSTMSAFRPRGYRVPAWSAGGAAMLLGTASFFLPHQASSVGPIWSVLVTVWGATLIALNFRSPDRLHVESAPVT